ncbi:MAG: formyltransferase family protein [Actinomycetota bacterium]
MTARIAVFGCKSTTTFLIEAIQARVPVDRVITLSPASAERAQVADYLDCAAYCADRGIDHHVVDDYTLKDPADQELIRGFDLDLGFVMGWQRLIPAAVLDTFGIGVFGMHGSADDLPIGRGRSPMNWALIEQRPHFFTNLFRYDPGVDSGDVLDTLGFSIQPADTAETMHYKNSLAMKTLIYRNLDALLAGDVTLHKQRDAKPTYYPKRSPADSQIDFEQDLASIEALVRAVAHPFNGAFTFVDGKRLTIWRAATFETDLVPFGFEDQPWGTIVEVFQTGKFLIKCRGGLLLVHEYEGDATPAVGQRCVPVGLEQGKFERNADGYHDLPAPPG